MEVWSLIFLLFHYSFLRIYVTSLQIQLFKYLWFPIPFPFPIPFRLMDAFWLWISFWLKKTLRSDSVSVSDMEKHYFRFRFRFRLKICSGSISTPEKLLKMICCSRFLETDCKNDMCSCVKVILKCDYHCECEETMHENQDNEVSLSNFWLWFVWRFRIRWLKVGLFNFLISLLSRLYLVANVFQCQQKYYSYP